MRLSNGSNSKYQYYLSGDPSKESGVCLPRTSGEGVRLNRNSFIRLKDWVKPGRGIFVVSTTLSLRILAPSLSPVLVVPLPFTLTTGTTVLAGTSFEVSVAASTWV